MGRPTIRRVGFGPGGGRDDSSLRRSPGLGCSTVGRRRIGVGRRTTRPARAGPTLRHAGRGMRRGRCTNRRGSRRRGPIGGSSNGASRGRGQRGRDGPGWRGCIRRGAPGRVRRGSRAPSISAGGRRGGPRDAGREPISREAGLDLAPAAGIAVIAGRERPYGMEVVGQQDDRRGGERPPLAARTQGLAQNPTGPGVLEDRGSSVGNDREEIRPARYEISSEVRHRIVPVVAPDVPRRP